MNLGKQSSYLVFTVSYSCLALFEQLDHKITRTTECNFVPSLEQENSMVRDELNIGAGVLKHA